MKRRTDGERHRTFGAAGLCQFARTFHRRLGAGNHHLTRRVVVGHDTDRVFLVVRRLFHRLACGVFRQFDGCAQKRAHRADADRHRLLHGMATNAQEPCCVRHAERARRTKRGVLTQRMSGHDTGMTGDIESAFLAQDRDGRHRGRHDGRLRIFREQELIIRSLPHQAGEILLQGFVHFLEQFAGGGERLSQRLAHADGLASLAGKDECACHGRALTRAAGKRKCRVAHPLGHPSAAAGRQW